ncbi:TPR-like protein [Cryphonectria parasitica EP155]|uniref:TPR-like protein n=1 Tax=Cryphonectria parasitica (strain ATCC 38755 / EP155) TaxID=660469 RepID=A0A9P5CVG2_CRYP1|nr:TPR-like protein [Cryphonectria parasitica EP155]KAF3770675.1 TPR-like protein [Cryphonectria parasitica EP155]
MVFTEQDIDNLRASLQDAVVKCSERCLYQSAKWAAELLDSLPEPPTGEDAGVKVTNTPRGYMPAILTPNPDEVEAELEALEFNKYIMAKSFFDCREFDRCTAVFLPDALLSSILSPRNEDTPLSSQAKGKEAASSNAYVSGSSSLPEISQKSLFLALYAKMLSGEKRKDEDTEMVMGPQDLGSVCNKQLPLISRYLKTWFDERRASPEDISYEGSQGWLEYLYGMVLAKEKNTDEALQWFLRSVHLFPMNWGCWLEMTGAISRPTNELQTALAQLQEIFPDSPFLLTCSALYLNHTKALKEAAAEFSHLLSLHPHRLDHLDIYSNILFVLNERPKLAFLAHLCSSVDKFRPETCVVVGNYYSLLSQHEKAVQYFRRALALDRSCLSAWTLMGHEYVELKNTHAAIESYRHGVDINRRDYRAWYGLGQTYEMLEMYQYALWYYKKAAGLRPWDGKMWMAVGSCLQKLGRERDGIKALKRALLADTYYESSTSSFGSAAGFDRAALGQLDTDVLIQIATMYEALDEEEEARAYMELCVAQEDGNVDGIEGSAAIESAGVLSDEDQDSGEDREKNQGTGVTTVTSKARMWLAKYALRHEDFVTANRLASELCQDGQDVEEAKAIMRDARDQMEFAEGHGVG